MVNYTPEELEILSEVNAEFHDTSLLSECRIVEFVSRSSGRQRSRQPRHVTFLQIGKVTYYVDKEGSVRTGRHYPIDSLAEDILVDIPHEQRTVETLFARVANKERF
jgi:hypothetical protein